MTSVVVKALIAIAFNLMLWWYRVCYYHYYNYYYAVLLFAVIPYYYTDIIIVIIVVAFALLFTLFYSSGVIVPFCKEYSTESYARIIDLTKKAETDERYKLCKKKKKKKKKSKSRATLKHSLLFSLLFYFLSQRNSKKRSQRVWTRNKRVRQRERERERERTCKVSTNVLDGDKTVCQLYPAHLTFTLASPISHHEYVRARIACDAPAFLPSAKEKKKKRKKKKNSFKTARSGSGWRRKLAEHTGSAWNDPESCSPRAETTIKARARSKLSAGNYLPEENQKAGRVSPAFFARVASNARSWD